MDGFGMAGWFRAARDPGSKDIKDCKDRKDKKGLRSTFLVLVVLAVLYVLECFPWLFCCARSRESCLSSSERLTRCIFSQPGANLLCGREIGPGSCQLQDRLGP